MFSNILITKTGQRKNNGFTLVELMVVVAILGILVAIAVPIYTSNTEAAKIATDQANLRILNSATLHYRINEDMITSDVFEGITTNEERLQVLVDHNHINAVPMPQQDELFFAWDIPKQLWVIDSVSSQAGNFLSYKLFDKDHPKYYKRFHAGSWESIEGGEGGFKWGGAGGQGLIYFENPNSEYDITARVTLGPYDDSIVNAGGYGVLFESTLKPDTKELGHYIEQGYIVLFDRALERIHIRERNNPANTSADRQIVSKTIGGLDDGKDIVIEGYAGKTGDWWTQEHQIKLSVNQKDDKKYVSVFINGLPVFNDVVIENPVDKPDENYSGFRSWHGPSVQPVFHELVIEPLK
jgi:prepilin-type N-terminal cleavage/methylation domain-containing protein